MKFLQIMKYRKNKRNLLEGIQLEKPKLFVPWDVTPVELTKMFEGAGLNKVTNEYFTIECISHGGLTHVLGFHFNRNHSNKLHILEFFRKSYPDYHESFTEFQKHFEKTYGRSTKEYPINSEGFPSFEWRIGTEIRIQHYIMDRFGLEERLHIQKAR
ncbi:hypothetical protein [Paenibacillus alkalitolerans]|uniref:hypothetical protein n=1 Tax=Paenibacillus alkalitolerans TaxID=2799335 RepID=UPI0018F3A5DB|nr:hypothetical protein [Paenibacillus alkalitolerans]